MKTLVHFARLTPRARRTVAAAAVLQVGARMTLAMFGLSATVRIATWLPGRSPRQIDVLQLRWALAASAARVGGTCLTQAIAARAMGARGSASSRLVIGMRPGAAAPEFHAWTEIADVTLPTTLDAETFTRMRVWN